MQCIDHLPLIDVEGPNTTNILCLQHFQNTIHMLKLCKRVAVFSMFLALKMAEGYAVSCKSCSTNYKSIKCALWCSFINKNLIIVAKLQNTKHSIMCRVKISTSDSDYFPLRACPIMLCSFYNLPLLCIICLTWETKNTQIFVIQYYT